MSRGEIDSFLEKSFAAEALKAGGEAPDVLSNIVNSKGGNTAVKAAGAAFLASETYKNFQQDDIQQKVVVNENKNNPISYANAIPDRTYTSGTYGMNASDFIRPPFRQPGPAPTLSHAGVQNAVPGGYYGRDYPNISTPTVPTPSGAPIQMAPTMPYTSSNTGATGGTITNPPGWINPVTGQPL